MSMFSSRLRSSALAGLTAVAMTSGALLPVQTANAAGIAFGAMSAYTTTNAALGGGSVLGLEGDDEAAAASLTAALRREFAARGVGGGKEMSTLELKLTMGCEEPPPPGCMAEGGRTLGVSQMIYGSVVKAGDSYTVDLTFLDVDGGAVKETLKTPLSADAFGEGVIDQTAKDLVNQMLGAEPEPEPEPAVASPAVPGPVVHEPTVDDGGGLVWGRHDAARWKKIGLVTSGALAVVSIGAAVATSLMIRRDGPVYNDLIDAAKGSLEDDTPGNDINPNTMQDLCDVARTAPPGEMGTVTNKPVAEVCRRGDTLATVATASWVGAGIFAASTIAFTTLLFVHKEKKDGATAKLRAHGAAVGVSPMSHGGAMVGGRWSF